MIRPERPGESGERRYPPGLWVAITILTSVLICGGVAAMHYLHQDALDRYTREIAALRQTRIDLAQGFLTSAWAARPNPPGSANRAAP